MPPLEPETPPASPKASTTVRPPAESPPAEALSALNLETHRPTTPVLSAAATPESVMPPLSLGGDDTKVVDQAFQPGAAFSAAYNVVMAGSSLPVCWRNPWLEHDIDSKIDEALAIGFSGLEIYGFHTLEVLQCMVERRRGGARAARRARRRPARLAPGRERRRGRRRHRRLRWLSRPQRPTNGRAAEQISQQRIARGAGAAARTPARAAEVAMAPERRHARGARGERRRGERQRRGGRGERLARPFASADAAGDVAA